MEFIRETIDYGDNYTEENSVLVEAFGRGVDTGAIDKQAEDSVFNEMYQMVKMSYLFRYCTQRKAGEQENQTGIEKHGQPV